MECIKSAAASPVSSISSLNTDLSRKQRAYCLSTLNAKMNKMCLAHLGFFLLALLFITTQVVQAQNTTVSMNTSMPTVSVNKPTPKGGCGRTEAFTLLLPVAVAASLLYSWS